MSKHNRERRRKGYAGKVLEMGLQGLADGTVLPGRVYSVGVAHDDWCDLLAGRGECNCEPDVLPPKLVPRAKDN